MRWKLEHNGEIIKNKKKTAEETLHKPSVQYATVEQQVQRCPVWSRVLNPSQGYHSEPGAEAIRHLNYSTYLAVSRTRHYSVVSLLTKKAKKR